MLVQLIMLALDRIRKMLGPGIGRLSQRSQFLAKECAEGVLRRQPGALASYQEEIMTCMTYSTPQTPWEVTLGGWMPLVGCVGK